MAVVMIAVMMAGVAQAAIVHGNFSGANVNYLGVTEDSGTDTTPLYGTPTITGNTLKFSPTSFVSASPTGPATGDTTDGQLRFTVEAKNGTSIDALTFSEFGDYTLLVIGGGNGAIASTTLTIFATDNFTNNTQSATTNGTTGSSSSPWFQIGTGSQGASWTATKTFTFTPGFVTRVEIVLNNTLQTSVTPGATAHVAKKGFNVGVTSGTVIPEPASLALLAAGTVLVSYGRFRRVRR